MCLFLLRCAVAQPPTTLPGAPLTNAEDRALARLVEVAWDALDEMDPIARDEAGGPAQSPAWPPATPAAYAESAARLAPIRRQLAGIEPQALSEPWRASLALLERRMAVPTPQWDVLTLQNAIGRGLWASLGPEAWPAARSTDRLDALDHFLTRVRTATAATTRERMAAASDLLDQQRVWVSQVSSANGQPGFGDQRDIAVAALDAHEMHLQENLRSTSTEGDVPSTRPWTGRWVRVPSAAEIDAAAERTIAATRSAMQMLSSADADADVPSRPRASSKLGPPPDDAPSTIAAFLESLPSYLGPASPVPPAVTATTAPPALAGLAAVRLDEVHARTSTQAYRVFLSVSDDPLFKRVYPPAKLMALALYEGWPGRGLRDWALRTHRDRGTTERRWADPVMAAGWPLFALDRLLNHDRVPKAVRWHVQHLLLRAAIDAQADLRARGDKPLDDDALLAHISDLGRQSNAEARRKLALIQLYPGRLTAPFLGWWTLTQLADRHVRPGDRAAVRRLAACSEWPPDLIDDCLATAPARQER